MEKSILKENKTLRYKNLSLFILMIGVLVYACNPKTQPESNASTNETLVPPEVVVNQLIEHLKTNKPLQSFFATNWIFIYHEDNRCEGSTDGVLNGLHPTSIDQTIKLTVKNDGDGWMCEPKELSEFELAFQLREQLTNWDRIELAPYETIPKNVFVIHGAGESDYLQVTFNEHSLITELKYSSEDPG